MTYLKRIAALFLLLLSGCSTQFVYNHLDWFSSWYIDDYITLNDQQTTLYDQLFTSLWQWHRQEELRQYQLHVEAIRRMLDQPSVAPAQVEEQMQAFRSHWQRLSERAEPALFQLAQTLTDAQVDEFLANLEQENREYEQRTAKLSPNEQVEERQQRIEEFLRDWLGSLTEQQQQIAARLSQQMAATQPEWLASRRLWARSFKATMAEERDSDSFRQNFRQLVIDAKQFQTPAYQQQREHNRTLWIAALTELLNQQTDAQLAHLLAELRDWRTLFKDLQQAQTGYQIKGWQTDITQASSRPSTAG